MDEKNSDQTIRCPYCLASNPITASVCETCGKSLTEAPQNNPAGTYSKANNNVKFDGDISNTITGLLLLGIGTGIAWIPYVQYFAIFLNLIGVILIFLNRHSFETKHSTYVILSIAIYLVAFVIGVIIAVAGVLSIVTTTSFSTLSLSQQESLIRGQMQTIILGTIIAGMIGSIAYFTITYGLQDEKGKLLLLIGLVSYFIVEAIIGAFLYSYTTAILNSTFSNNSFHQSNLTSFSGDLTLYSMLTVIPMVTYAIAYLRIRSVIQKENNEGGSAANLA